jgi:hypothetical protein
VAQNLIGKVIQPNAANAVKVKIFIGGRVGFAAAVLTAATCATAIGIFATLSRTCVAAWRNQQNMAGELRRGLLIRARRRVQTLSGLTTTLPARSITR